MGEFPAICNPNGHFGCWTWLGCWTWRRVQDSKSPALSQIARTLARPRQLESFSRSTRARHGNPKSRRRFRNHQPINNDRLKSLRKFIPLIHYYIRQIQSDINFFHPISPIEAEIRQFGRAA
jgi:hypothetical protein